MKKPNIIYIHSHDTGRFIQPYGAAVPSPGLQAFADESVLFRQAFCANPTCSPSRASLLSGQYPHVCGMFGLAHRGFEMNDYSQHLAAHLKRHGYHTVLAGHQHEIPHGREPELGYEEVPGTNETGLEAAEAFLSRDPLPEPFFLSVGFIEAHRPFHPAGPHERADRCAPPPGIPDTPETRQDMVEFHASVRVFDEKAGRILGEIRRRRLEENTLVIITTDHGIPFPGYKCNLTDRGIGVLLMVRFPRGDYAGTTVDGMISHVDVFPSLCEVAGIPVPEWVQGVSFMPLVRGTTEQIHDEIFAEMDYHSAYEPMRCVRTPRYKYIRRWSESLSPVLNNCNASACKEVWENAGWKHMRLDKEELYDLSLDPGEHKNRIHVLSLSGVAEEMRGRLQCYMESTNDPLLSGFVEYPAGAVVDYCE